ncbi:hypothetical protein BDR26DRAFT_852315 [Obelidium mucronatum]|nr:hypothetical protein BDR26DRAFT_852315 [Obelidium mucronatum]
MSTAPQSLLFQLCVFVTLFATLVAAEDSSSGAVGGGIGGVVTLIIVIFLIYCCCCRRTETVEVVEVAPVPTHTVVVIKEVQHTTITNN